MYELELSIGKTYSDLLGLNEKVTLSTLEGNNTYTGTVSRINARVDQATQTIQVFVEVKGENLKEGMYLEAQLEAKEEPNAIEISRKLLVDEDEIFIIQDSILNTITIDPVYFSPKNVVVKGVPDGTKILAKPIPGAYAGMRVKVNEDSLPGDASVNQAVQ